MGAQTLRNTVAKVKDEALVDNLADTLVEVETETLIDTLVKVKAEGRVDAMATTQAEQESERPSDTGRFQGRETSRWSG